MFIPFAEYAPDSGLFSETSATDVRDVIPAGSVYRAAGGIVERSSALPAACVGAINATSIAGNSYLNAGTAAGLYGYIVSTDTWSDLSKVGGYSLGSTDKWRFCQFGSDVIAVSNGSALPQIRDMSVGGVYADIASAPTGGANCVGRVRDFLVLGNTSGNNSSRVHWSAIGDPTDFTVSATTQCDYQDLPLHYGDVTAIVGGDVGYVFQERAITRMTYVGSPTIFQFDTVIVDEGTTCPDSVVMVGGVVYYLGLEGFCAFNGQQITRIGENKVDQTLKSAVTAGNAHKIVGAHDPGLDVVVWSIPYSTSGVANTLFYYSLADGPYRWSRVDEDTEWILPAETATFTTWPSGAITTEYSSMSVIGFTDDHKFGNFGTSKTGKLYTGRYQASDGLSIVKRVRPIVDKDATVSAVYVGYIQYFTQTTWTAKGFTKASNASWVGRANGRYHQARVDVTNFDEAKGVNVEEITTTGKK